MTTYTTEYKKTDRGPKMITKISLGPAKERHGDRIGERVLCIETDKTYRGGAVETRATVRLDMGNSWQTLLAMGKVTHPRDGDYDEKLQEIPAARVTEKTVRQAHAAAEHKFPDVFARAVAFYAQEG